MKFKLIAFVFGQLLSCSLSAAPLKVFILAGQSNMQGHAKQSTFDYISKDPKTADLYKLMTDGKGEPASTDKGWISYLSESRSQEPTLKEGKKLSGKEKAEYTEKRTAELLSQQEQDALAGVSNFQFHYHGSAKVLGGIGVQFAEALIPFAKK